MAFQTRLRQQSVSFMQWAADDQVIIICGAGNQAGVVEVYKQIEQFNYTIPDINLPVALFREDVQSMNGMATACGVLVPSRYYDAVYSAEIGDWVASEDEELPLTSHEKTVIAFLKSYKLA
jgi:hypothetical protein